MREAAEGAENAADALAHAAGGETEPMERNSRAEPEQKISCLVPEYQAIIIDKRDTLGRALFGARVGQYIYKQMSRNYLLIICSLVLFIFSSVLGLVVGAGRAVDPRLLHISAGGVIFPLLLILVFSRQSAVSLWHTFEAKYLLVTMVVALIGFFIILGIERALPCLTWFFGNLSLVLLDSAPEKVRRNRVVARCMWIGSSASFLLFVFVLLGLGDPEHRIERVVVFWGGYEWSLTDGLLIEPLFVLCIFAIKNAYNKQHNGQQMNILTCRLQKRVFISVEELRAYQKQENEKIFKLVTDEFERLQLASMTEAPEKSGTGRAKETSEDGKLDHHSRKPPLCLVMIPVLDAIPVNSRDTLLRIWTSQEWAAYCWDLATSKSCGALVIRAAFAVSWALSFLIPFELVPAWTGIVFVILSVWSLVVLCFLQRFKFLLLASAFVPRYLTAISLVFSAGFVYCLNDSRALIVFLALPCFWFGIFGDAFPEGGQRILKSFTFCGVLWLSVFFISLSFDLIENIHVSPLEIGRNYRTTTLQLCLNPIQKAFPFLALYLFRMITQPEYCASLRSQLMEVSFSNPEQVRKLINKRSKQLDRMIAIVQQPLSKKTRVGQAYHLEIPRLVAEATNSDKFIKALRRGSINRRSFQPGAVYPEEVQQAATTAASGVVVQQQEQKIL